MNCNGVLHVCVLRIMFIFSSAETFRVCSVSPLDYMSVHRRSVPAAPIWFAVVVEKIVPVLPQQLMVLGEE